jgi:chemotaxis protein CheD
MRLRGGPDEDNSVADNSVAVGLGEVKVSDNPLEILVAYGLGSCVAVAMYDPVARVAGLLHAVLPYNLNGTEALSAKYVDSGIAALLHKLAEAGASRQRLIVRLAGGANMLVAPGFNATLNIGERNVAAAHATLATYKLKIKSEDVGGHTGRTVRLFVADGRMTVRVLGSQEREL